MNPASTEIIAWIRSFAAAVRARDFAAAESLFLEDVVGFGTVGHMLTSRADLRRHQWEIVWNRTTGFDFDERTLVVQEGHGIAAVLAEWSSTGYDPSQKPFLRRGRATILLQRVEGGWKASHTHFSFTPAAFHDPLFHH